MASPKRGAKRPTPESPAAEPPSELFVRNIPPHVAEAIDRWAAEWTEERGTKVTRADVVRELLHRAVKRAEKGESP